VVGASVVGLFIAQALARRGYRCALIGPEAVASRQTEGFDARIYALSPASWAWIAQQGLSGLIDGSRITPITRMQLHAAAWSAARRGSQSSPPASSALPMLEFDAAREVREELAVTVEQSELMHAGRQALAFSGVTRLNASLAQLGAMEAGAGQRTMLLSDGSVLSARLILGCDGAHSALRRLAGFRVRQHDYRARAVVANFACEYPHRNIASQWFTEEGVVALLPLPGYRVSLVWSAPEDLAAALMRDSLQGLAARVEQRCQTLGGPCALGRLTCLGAPASFALTDLQVDSPVADRVALLADAAHVVHPMAGQGLNLGIGDLMVLNDQLARPGARQDPGHPAVLARYRRARREAVLSMSLLTRGLDQWMQLSSDRALGRTLGWAWTGLARSALLKSFLIARAVGHGPYRSAHPLSAYPRSAHPHSAHPYSAHPSGGS